MAPPLQTISVTSVVSSGYQTTSSYNFAFTVPPSANRFLDVDVSMLSVVGASVVSVTYGAAALALLRADVSASGSIRTEIWTLVAPAVGTDTITVTLSTGLASVTGVRATRGVSQSRPLFSSLSATNTIGPGTSIAVDAPLGGLVLDVLATAAASPSAGQAENWNSSGALGTGAGSMAGPVAAPGAQSMAWTVGVNPWVQTGFALTPAIDEAVIGGYVTQTAIVTRQRAVGY